MFFQIRLRAMPVAGRTVLATGMVSEWECARRSASNALRARIPRTGHVRKARILLADDHPHFTEMEEQVLEPEFEVIGKVHDGQALFEQAIRLKPDVIVTDVSMPILNGLDAANRLMEAGCRSLIVFLTVHADLDLIRRSLSIGASGYVVKSRIATELITAVRETLAGNLFVSQHLPRQK